jgi:hypothetical protein
MSEKEIMCVYRKQLTRFTRHKRKIDPHYATKDL